jgi:hypothetical protein
MATAFYVENNKVSKMNVKRWRIFVSYRSDEPPCYEVATFSSAGLE